MYYAIIVASTFSRQMVCSVEQLKAVDRYDLLCLRRIEIFPYSMRREDAAIRADDTDEV
jgi:hypothetical protein